MEMQYPDGWDTVINPGGEDGGCGIDDSILIGPFDWYIPISGWPHDV